MRKVDRAFEILGHRLGDRKCLLIEEMDIIGKSLKKNSEVKSDLESIITSMSIEFDEYGMEPTTITNETGAEIKNYYVKKLKQKLEELE